MLFSDSGHQNGPKSVKKSKIIFGLLTSVINIFICVWCLYMLLGIYVCVRCIYLKMQEENDAEKETSK